MNEQEEIPYRWKIGVLVIMLALTIGAYYAVAWLLTANETCTSEAHLSDACDPYLPNVPGKEGR